MGPCKKCGGETRDYFGQPWCDKVCHGVVTDTGVLLLRHVATVDGSGGRLPIVHDASLNEYLFRWPGKKNPRFSGDSGSIETSMDVIPSTPILSTFGPLDVVMTSAFNAVRAKGTGEQPLISIAPSCTKEEKALIGV